MKKYLPFLLLCITVLSCKKKIPEGTNSGWATYAGSKEGNRYSSNQQINLQNVKQLKVAWVYSSNDKDTLMHSQNECNPIAVDGVLYGTSPKLKLFALDAATGVQKWLFDPAMADSANNRLSIFHICRGVVYWQDENGDNKRIFYSVGPRTYAIDADNGQPIKNFGKGGYIDLTQDLDRKTNSFVAGTTPGIIYKDLLIIGARVDESEDAAPGHIRAYNTLTGKLAWIFHTIPHPGEIGYNTWPDSTAWKRLGSANNWSGMALDEKRGIVYIPTGSVGGDFYGGNRKGPDLFANCLLALDAATGKYIWHYQVIHHDLWDRDLPANPNLVTIRHDGKTIDAVAQITKHGFVFVFDRTNGKPVFPINEEPVPTNGLPGEEPWPTQPIPTLPQPFTRQHFGPGDVTDISPATHADMLAKYKKVKYNARFTPPTKEGGFVFPGFDGGGEWGGAAVDPESSIMYISTNETPSVQIMIDVPKAVNTNTLQGMGHAVYNNHCIACHGPGLKGNGTAYPSLVNINKRYNEQQVSAIIANGRNMMPSFKQISPADKKALLAFVLKLPGAAAPAPLMSKEPPATITDSSKPVPYVMDGYRPFLDNDGYPGIKPPWGTLNAINLATGKLLWKTPLGEFPALTKKGIPITGTQVYGGPLVTKGGLVFIAAAQDEKIRAFDKLTGKEVWEAKLPAAGYATPATYQVNGKQYVVIACGGGKLGSKSGDSYVCFALPD
jgi:quinoprotein glucose dehydrogenase